jgi:hypothetical protein
MTGGAPFSKAGVKSTSLGIIPLFKRLIMPLLMSSSEIGGGSVAPVIGSRIEGLIFHFLLLKIPPNDFLAVYDALPDHLPCLMIPVSFCYEMEFIIAVDCKFSGGLCISNNDVRFMLGMSGSLKLGRS